MKYVVSTPYGYVKTRTSSGLLSFTNNVAKAKTFQESAASDLAKKCKGKVETR